MPEIQKTFTFDDLPIKPPLKGRPRISEDIQQSMSSIVGWDGLTRRLLKCSPSGILYTSPPSVRGILNITADQDNYTYQGEGIDTSEILVSAHPLNAGDVWVNVGVAASVDNGYYLDASDWISLGISNLKSLNLFVTDNTDKVIVIYSK